MPTRDEALALKRQHTPSLALQRHMLAVETCVRAYATKFGEDVELWGLAGLLHDFDYEQHPEEHPLWGMAVLRQLGYPAEVVDAIAAHYPGKTGKQPESKLERTLFACDELSGLITAVTYVRPSKSILDVEVRSVLKKLREPSFAAGVNRDDVHTGVDLLKTTIEDHVEFMLAAMKASAAELGLLGT